jgi:uncharacterized protein YcgI (DUF1989 family)
MTFHWKVEQHGKFTTRSSLHETLIGTDSAIERAEQFIAAATTDPAEQKALLDAVFAAEPGEPVTLPNGKRLEIIDLGEQF